MTEKTVMKLSLLDVTVVSVSFNYLNVQTRYHYSSSHCSRCMLVKSIPANYSPKIASNLILLFGDTPLEVLGRERSGL